MNRSWTEPDRTRVLEDEAVRLIPLDVERDGEALWRAADPSSNGGEDLFRWSLGTGPFADRKAFLIHLTARVGRLDELTYTVVRKSTDQVVGGLSLLNIRAAHGAVEAGSIWYTKKAQRSEVNSHTLFVIMDYVLSTLGYRRLEWKCNHENLPSRRAASRLGFRFEGTFRNHFWDKGRNRDTDWFSITEEDWPSVRTLFETKLLRGPSPSNPRATRAQRSYLPLWYDLTGKSVLIVGGGKAAWQKVRALASFDLPVVIVSPDFLPELSENSLGANRALIRQAWEPSCLSGATPAVGLVLACTSSEEVNRQVVSACRERGLPVLDASNPEAGDFIQPATRRAGDFTLAVSSGGIVPRGAVAVRDALAAPFDEAARLVSS